MTFVAAMEKINHIFSRPDYLIKAMLDNFDVKPLFVWPGGADVHPQLYGHKDLGSYTDKESDDADIALFNKSDDSRLKLGICRGSQFLTVMAGGRLIQDVSNHAIAGTHTIQEAFCVEGGVPQEYSITSTHHQMHFPFNLRPGEEYQIVAYSSPNRSGHYTYKDGTYSYSAMKVAFPDFVEPEIVYYPKIHALAIQGHPEYMNADSRAVKRVEQLIKYFQ